jgi:hypothetical protein
MSASEPMIQPTWCIVKTFVSKGTQMLLSTHRLHGNEENALSNPRGPSFSDERPL